MISPADWPRDPVTGHRTARDGVQPAQTRELAWYGLKPHVAVIELIRRRRARRGR